MEGNGQESTGSERLDRIERALELMDDHILFREEHKQLLTSQVLLTGSIEKVYSVVDKVGTEVGTLSAQVDKLTANVSLMRENFDNRLKRLENS